MADGKYVGLDAEGNKAEEQAIVSSSGAPDAGKMVRTGPTGVIDDSFLPGSERITAVASEALTVDDLVNFWDDTGVAKMRKADASNNMPADGFVKVNVTIGNTATVYGEGKLTGTGMTPGKTQFLSPTTPGKWTETPPTTAGHLLQKVGRTANATTVVFERGEAIKRV